MALITTSAAIARISGSIGAVNFARTRSGPVARQRLRRTRSSSARQLEQRALLANAHAEWLALTDDNRAAWSAAARHHPRPNRLGIPRTLSGWQLFASLLSTRGYEVLEQWATPPRIQKSFPIYNVAIAEAPGPAYNITWDPYTSIPTKSCQLFASRPVSSTRLSHPKYWTFLGIRKPATDPWDVYSIFVDALGVPQSGEVLYFRIRIWTYNLLPSDLQALSLVVS